MKKLKLTLAVFMSVFMMYGLNAQHYNNRYADNHYQDERFDRKIRKGIRNGDLTKKEIRHLKRELRYLDKLKRKAWRNGRLNKWEETKILKHTYKFERLLDKYLYNRHRSSEKYHYKRDWSWDKHCDDHDYDFYFRDRDQRNRRH